MAEIKIVTIDELRQMNDQEGLILQGCGGDLQEWVDGINELFAQAGILQAGSAWKAEAVRSFQYDGLTNLLFPFEGVLMDVGKLAMWRLQTREQFGGTWRLCSQPAGRCYPGAAAGKTQNGAGGPRRKYLRHPGPGLPAAETGRAEQTGR